MALPDTLQDREMQKFDATGLPTGQTAVRVTGANFSGNVTVKGLSIEGRHQLVPINSSTWTQLPATALDQRNIIAIQNNTGQDIRINFDDSVAGFVGILIRDGSERAYDIQGSIPIYAKCSTGTASLDIEELA